MIFNDFSLKGSNLVNDGYFMQPSPLKSSGSKNFRKIPPETCLCLCASSSPPPKEVYASPGMRLQVSAQTSAAAASGIEIYNFGTPSFTEYFAIVISIS